MKTYLKRPLLTEKSTALAKKGAFTFLVDEHANAHEVARAVAETYNVHPKKVRIVKNPKKMRGVRSNRLVRRALKKAVVRLKQGEKIAAFNVEEKK